METTKDEIIEKAHDYCFENYSALGGKGNLDHIKEQGFLDGVEWLHDQQSASQKEAIERLYNAVTKIKNPYSKEKQYQQWAAYENVLDTIIRSAPFQEVKQLLSNTETKDQ